MAFSSLEKTIAVLITAMSLSYDKNTLPERRCIMLITAMSLSYYKKNSGAGGMTIAPEVGIKRGLAPVCVKFISWSRRLWRLSRCMNNYMRHSMRSSC